MFDLKVLLLGKSGMLGSQFLKTLSGSEDFEMYAFDKNDLDITDGSVLSDVFGRISPDFVLNCAAYTAVDDCEVNKELAFRINGEAVGLVAAACQREGAALVHFSTDYVFDGSVAVGYAEGDETSPINVYGASKLLGEELIAKNMEDFYVVRTSWLFGENGKNFVDTMIDLARSRDELSVVDDQVGSPTYTNDLCNGVAKFFLRPFLIDVFQHHLRVFESNEDVLDRLPFGVYHLTNSGHTSWFGFAKEIFDMMGIEITVKPVSSDEFPRPAKRPASSILRNTRIGACLRPWEQALQAYIDLNHVKS